MPGRKIFIYRDPSSNLNFDEIKDFLGEKLKNFKEIEIELRGDFFTYFLKNDKKSEEAAKKIAGARVFDIAKQKNEKEAEPFRAEVELEKKAIKTPQKKVSGVIYDGFLLENICHEIIPAKEKKLNFTHIIFLNRLFATFEEGEDRYHARAIICGFPSLISAQGIVEAPAKPREYYIAKTFSHLPSEVLKEKFKGKFLNHSDKRLTEAAKGYALQAVFYQLFGEAFCENKSCRLYNAHYQEELINAQLKNKKQELCKKHAKMLRIY